MSGDCPATSDRRRDPQTEALQLLEKAGITGNRVPATFDGARFLEDLRDVKETHAIWEAAETSISKADRRRMDAVASAAARLTDALRTALEHPSTAHPLTNALPPAQEAGALVPHASSAARLRTLLSEAEGLQRAATNGGYAPFPDDGAEAHGHLIAVKLPKIFKQHLGRKCGFSTYSGEGDEPTEGVLFIVAAMQHMGLRSLGPEAVKKARQRYLASRNGDTTL